MENENIETNQERNEEQIKLIKKKEIISGIQSMLLFVVIVLVLTFLLITFVGQRTTVSGSSMESTLSSGDNLIIDKISYRFHDPERFDIIVFPYQWDEDTFYIKRIIGLPGESVRIDMSGNIYINDTLLDEDYGLARITNPGSAIETIYLGEDEYFVLGDNRNNSSDSRMTDVGMIHRKKIVGRAWLRIFPFNKINFLEHGN